MSKAKEIKEKEKYIKRCKSQIHRQIKRSKENNRHKKKLIRIQYEAKRTILAKEILKKTLKPKSFNKERLMRTNKCYATNLHF